MIVFHADENMILPSTIFVIIFCYNFFVIIYHYAIHLHILHQDVKFYFDMPTEITLPAFIEPIVCFPCTVNQRF